MLLRLLETIRNGDALSGKYLLRFPEPVERLTSLL